MPKKLKPADSVTVCRGGKSINCNHEAHSRGRRSYNCRRCKNYMGCSICAERAYDLICLNCNDWADDAGEKKHGKLEPRAVAAGKVREIKDKYLG